MWRISVLGLLVCLAGSVYGSTRGGNGGEGSKAFDFHQHALMFIEALAQLHPDARRGLQPELLQRVLQAAYIKPVESCDAIGLDGENIDRPAACNFPTADPLRIEVTDEWTNLPELTKIGVAGHELAGLLGLEINTYNLTSPVMIAIKEQLGGDSDPYRPRLLDQAYAGNSQAGFSFEEANKHCAKVRRLSLKKNFYVYCELIRKNWQEQVAGIMPVSDFQFLGYEYIHQQAISEVAIGGIYLGARTRQDIRRPVIRRVERLVDVTWTEEHQIFGLKVYGLGQYRLDLPFAEWPQTLINSSLLVTVPDAVNPDVNHVIEEQTYPSVQSAHRVCVLTLRTAMREEPEKYYRSKCGIGKTEDERFYFVIKTQNPFVHEEF